MALLLLEVDANGLGTIVRVQSALYLQRQFFVHFPAKVDHKHNVCTQSCVVNLCRVRLQGGLDGN